MKKSEKVKARCLERIQYIKVIHLKQIKNNSEPIYLRNIPRFSKDDTKIYDEAVYYHCVVYDKPVKNYKTNARSSGIIDTQIILPWKDNLEFTDKGEAKIEGHLSQVINEPSNIFLTVSHFFNGSQKGNEDFATRMSENTDCGRLIADLSSIPNIRNILKGIPKGYLCCKECKDRPLSVVELRDNVYHVSMNNLKIDDVLRIDFEFDWNLL